MTTVFGDELGLDAAELTRLRGGGYLVSRAVVAAGIAPWKTAITDSDDLRSGFRGYDVTALMADATFADTVFLLHRGGCRRMRNAG